MEEWKEISGYSRYLASNRGRIWDKRTGKEVSQMLSGGIQYWYVNVYNDEGVRKLKRTHRLIAKAFCEGWSEERNDVDHINRDRFDNNASNLRWVSPYENNRNRAVTLFTDDSKTLTIKEWVRKNYPETEAASYCYIYRKMTEKDVSFEEAVEEYREYLKYGFDSEVVEYEGDTWYLADLCKKLNKSYEDVHSNLKKGWNLWESIYNVPPVGFYRYSYTLKLDPVGVVNIWYPSRIQMCEHLGVSEGILRDRLKKYECIEDIINHDPQERFRTTIHGVYGTKEEICKHFGTTLSAVETQMVRKKITFEEAVKMSRQRVRKIYINGNPSSPKELWSMFNISPKQANRIRNRKGLSFEDTLEYFGKDVSGIEITF